MAEAGEVEVTIGGKRETLKSSLRAARTVNGLGGFQEVFRRLAAFDLEAYVVVAAAGLGKKPDDVAEAVYLTGMPNLSEPLAIYVGYLANGGKAAEPAAEDAKPGEA